jgi:hypothetical protein
VTATDPSGATTSQISTGTSPTRPSQPTILAPRTRTLRSTSTLRTASWPMTSTRTATPDCLASQRLPVQHADGVQWRHVHPECRRFVLVQPRQRLPVPGYRPDSNQLDHLYRHGQ